MIYVRHERQQDSCLGAGRRRPKPPQLVFDDPKALLKLLESVNAPVRLAVHRVVRGDQIDALTRPGEKNWSA